MVEKVEADGLLQYLQCHETSAAVVPNCLTHFSSSFHHRKSFIGILRPSLHILSRYSVVPMTELSDTKTLGKLEVSDKSISSNE